MSYIEVTLGGKRVGIADEASIEIAKGCNNKCVGCYASKTTRMGERFFEMTPKEYDENAFRKSCKAVARKGISVVRMAKHCDPGDPTLRRTAVQVLEASAREGIQVVFVSKSIDWDKELSQTLIDGNHVLHVSLGMITTASSDACRKAVGDKYKKAGVKTYLRAVYDVTKEAPSLLRGVSNAIVTPMRFPSKHAAALYDADLSSYEFKNGYYRPLKMDSSWNSIAGRMCCGEVGSNIYCCNCGVCK